MRTQLAAWHTSLWAALGLAAACGGRALSEDIGNPAGGSGGTSAGVGGRGGGGGSGAAAGSGGSFVQFGGVSGFGGSDGSGGSVGAGGTFIDVGGAGGFVGTAGVPNAFPCTNARPRLGADGKPSGYVECERGWIRRPELRECASIVPRPNPVIQPSDGGAFDGGVPDGGIASCSRDSDCSHLLHGFCQLYPYGPGIAPFTACRSGCITDEDCGAGSVCLCGDPLGTCVKASCRTDADCGGLACASTYADGCGVRYATEFACQQPTDVCVGTRDCAVYELCTPAPGGRYCRNVGQCGRPFLVDGVPRLAPLVKSCPGWSVVVPATDALLPSTRDALARHFSDSGLMEHASIAAFGRFTLQLLAFGAPAALVEQAQLALADEIVHTKLCFALTSRYAGCALGPGPLPVSDALESGSFFDAVATAITEACIGETLAAIEAAEAAEHASDPEVRSALLTIAADEHRHAELGWKFLRWALDKGDETMRTGLVEHLQREVERELAAAVSAAEERPNRDAATLLAHGVLTADLRAEVRSAALISLILPLSRALSDAEQRLVA